MTNPQTDRESVERLARNVIHSQPYSPNLHFAAATLHTLLSERDALRAENARLREALEVIYRGDDSPDGMVADIARAAIQPPEGAG
jgi:cell shape-determining protein MreC